MHVPSYHLSIMQHGGRNWFSSFFVRCPFARSCWHILGITDHHSVNCFLDGLEALFTSKTDNELCVLISMCWKIWSARNDKIWNHITVSASHVYHYINNFLLERNVVNLTVSNSRSSTSSTVWPKPPPGLFKVNVDAALDPNSKKMGFGFVIRDSAGSLIVARCLPWFRLFKPGEAEAVGVREALKWLKSLNFDNLQLESDCLQVINRIAHNPTIFFIF